MKRLGKYTKSTLNQITINYGGEKISFNLMAEAKIVESNLMEEMESQPSNYGFLLLLHKKLTSQFEELKHDRKRLFAKLYLHAKENLKSKATGRYYSDDAAQAYAECHPKFVKLTKRCIKAKDDADTIYSAIKALEQKKDLMQTISSNNRAQKF